MKEIEQLDILLDYLRGALKEEDRILVEKKLHGNPKLAVLSDHAKAILDAIRMGVLHDCLEELKKTDQQEEIQEGIPREVLEEGLKVKMRRDLVEQLKAEDKRMKSGQIRLFHLTPVGKMLSIAASILLLITFWFLLSDSQKSSLQIYEDYFVPPSHLRSLRSESPEEETIRRAYSLYDREEFEAAIPMLNELWEAQRDTASLFFKGISLMATGDMELASNDLLAYRAITRSPEPRTSFYLALVNLHAENYEQARSELELILNTNSPYREKSQLLLEEIEKLENKKER